MGRKLSEGYDVRQMADILLVEDNPADQVLTTEGLKDSHWVNELHTVSDGAEALAFLRQQPPYEKAPRPALVLLDLNLPKKTGSEVLSEIKNDLSLKGIPVIVVTTSGAESDIEHSYQLGANCFLTKPLELEAYLAMVQGIEKFWLSLAVLPKN